MVAFFLPSSIGAAPIVRDPPRELLHCLSETRKLRNDTLLSTWKDGAAKWSAMAFSTATSDKRSIGYCNRLKCRRTT